MTTSGISNQENKDKEGTKERKQPCRRKLFHENNDLQCAILISNDGGDIEAMKSDMRTDRILRAAKKRRPSGIFHL